MKGNVVISNSAVIVLALFSALHFETLLLAQNKDAGAQSPRASTETLTGQKSVVARRRARKQRPTTKRNKCMPPSPPESTNSDERQPPALDAPPLILDPTDREPGPPKEIVPQPIDPADMPAIKKPPKKKAKPQ